MPPFVSSVLPQYYNTMFLRSWNIWHALIAYMQGKESREEYNILGKMKGLKKEYYIRRLFA